MIKKVLVANRGEIAIRVMRACKELDISMVAVYSTADRESLHLRFADEACLIGEPPPLESYLNMDVLIETAKKVGAEAIHPGYGFLAENSKFARRCDEAGIIFVGPNSKALALVGDKVASRETVKEAGVPLIPGMHSVGKELNEFKEEAGKVGYPVIIKARSAFGDESVYLEKYIEEPRHIEFQVLADNFGNVVHVFERECSIQRRHQKIVEETPSQAIDLELRNRMGETAKKVIKACGYTNAGTVEFLLDRDKNFYFLEVNARIQVEHPITELTTGVDLVKHQLRIASGEPLGLAQEDIHQRGHAIEARIYAEDPENDFLPSPGKIHFVKEPQGPGVRVDSGIYSGWEVPTFYDPILSKLIVWGEKREVARKRMIEALKNYVILGIKAPMEFLIDIMEHPKFVERETYTNFISKNMDGWKPIVGARCDVPLLDIALIAASLGSEEFPKAVPERRQITSPWQELGRWEICSHQK